MQVIKEINKERLDWVDVSKGILILMVVFGHMDNYAEMANINDPIIERLCLIERTWTPYFMCAFFIITGFCSNFSKPFKEFIVGKFKALIIPGVTISILVNIFEWRGIFNLIRPIPGTLIHGPAWFLSALFLSCIIYYIIVKYINNMRARILIYVALVSTGLALNMYLPQIIEFWYIPHAFMLTPFLEIGKTLKSRSHELFTIRTISISLLVYILSLLAILLLSNYDKIGIFRRITINWITLIPSYICAISGSIMIFALAHAIKRSMILKFLGKHTLVIYLLNTHFIVFYYRMLSNYFNVNVMQSVLTFFIAYIATMLTCSAISYLLNSKYTSFLLGKF